MYKWKCSECFDIEDTDLYCTIEKPTPDKPEFCPVNGYENEWTEDKDE